jgi:hypothetical protein
MNAPEHLATSRRLWPRVLLSYVIVPAIASVAWLLFMLPGLAFQRFSRATVLELVCLVPFYGVISFAGMLVLGMPLLALPVARMDWLLGI